MSQVHIYNTNKDIVYSIDCHDYILGSEIRDKVAKALNTNYLTFTLPSEGRILHGKDEITPSDDIYVYYSSFCSIL